ncbi:unnamed protein product [Miscanthus lutarioriparius]|uniref:Uncharacterized protein n=1 Tax=Miscanthus lutarioriparius TaxID=422564 RepID=A0A811SSC0_9POAL|nr:unnamed protein product [Miscanthus lutarioriparius]CAD6343442.1 unnamed protein product [Miscanthus lutarioriparius]
MAQTNDNDAFSPPVSQERVVITNKLGERLVGLLHHTVSNKIVVLCHGFIASKNDSLILDLAAALTKKGISVFRFDFSGNGFLTVHGSADKTIPVEDAYEFAKHVPNHKLHVIEGANHNYTAHRKEVADAVVDFITSNGAGEPTSPRGKWDPSILGQ